MPNISIKAYVDGQQLELYPEHIFDWSVKGFSCPTEDYSVGNVSELSVSFVTDLKLDSAALTVGDLGLYYIQDSKRLDMNDRWQYTCLSGSSPDDSFDAIIPDETWKAWANQQMTLQQLYLAIVGDYAPASTLPINGSYVIKTNFGYSGITKRKVLQWILQLAGSNIGFRRVMPEASGVVQPLIRTHGVSGMGASLMVNPTNIKSINLSDFPVPGIDRIWFGTDSSDVGISYGTGKQQLSMPGNPLINPEDTSFLEPLYNEVSGFQYSPMKVELFWETYSAMHIHPTFAPTLYQVEFNEWSLGRIVEFLAQGDYTGNLDVAKGCGIVYTKYPTSLDAGAEYIASGKVFNFELSQKGITLEGTGNPSRDAANSLISSELAQNGKFNRFQRTLDETASEIGNLEGDISSLRQRADSIESTISGLSTKASTISSDTLYYLATAAGSGVTTSTPGWTTAVQNMTATNQYLWTYHHYTYADNHSSDSTPVITGRYGQNGSNGQNGKDGTDGVGIQSITPIYYANATSTAPGKPASHVTSTTTGGGVWTLAVPTINSTYPYLFTCDEVKYSTGAYSWTTVVQNSALTQFNSRIEQNASNISSKVSQTDFNGNTIASLINQTATTVDIQANHINLNGAVTANNNVTIGTDGTIKAVNADISGSFNMTGGSVNITSSSSDTNIISLKSGNYNANIQPQAVNVSDKNYRTSVRPLGLNLRDTPKNTETWYMNDYISLTDNSTLKEIFALQMRNGIYFYDTSGQGKKRFSLDTTGLKLYDTAGALRTHVTNSDGIYFYNASGTTSYHLPMTGPETPTTVTGTITIASGFTNADPSVTAQSLRYTYLRKYGNVVELCYSVNTSNAYSNWHQIGTLPTGFRPSNYFTCHGYNNTDDSNAIFRITPAGEIMVYGDKRQPTLHTTFIL